MKNPICYVCDRAYRESQKMLMDTIKQRDDAIALNTLYDKTRHEHRNFAKNAQDQRDDWQKEAVDAGAERDRLRGRVYRLEREAIETRDLCELTPSEDELIQEVAKLRALCARLHNIGTGAETTQSDNEALILGVKLIEESYK